MSSIEDYAATLTEHLKTAWLGRAHRHLEHCNSTNDEAATWARLGAPHGALVTTRVQAHGRGRLGRKWSGAQSDDIFASFVLRPGPAAQLGALGLAVAVGLREGMVGLAPAAFSGALRVKWPNDILIGERKVAGILCECRWMATGPEVVIGFGVNVARTEFPPELVDCAIGLAQALAPAPCPQSAVVLAFILNALEEVIDAFLAQGGFAAIAGRYTPYCREIGHQVRIVESSGDGPIERWAQALGLDHDGALLVRDRASGKEVRIQSADVWLARPESDV
jgi:BirA family biotin operon repressor/biotin-[acetyl-CoA-carboxylase] ligase